MALKNVPTASTASAKSAATSSANAAPANAGALTSALAAIAYQFSLGAHRIRRASNAVATRGTREIHGRCRARNCRAARAYGWRGRRCNSLATALLGAAQIPCPGRRSASPPPSAPTTSSERPSRPRRPMQRLHLLPRLLEPRPPSRPAVDAADGCAFICSAGHVQAARPAATPGGRRQHSSRSTVERGQTRQPGKRRAAQ